MSSIFADSANRANISGGLKFIVDSWILAIVSALSQNSLRFTQIQNEIKINPTTLSNRLKLLEKKGIVLKSVGQLDNQSVEYSLTQKGADAIPILESIFKYIEKHGLE